MLDLIFANTHTHTHTRTHRETHTYTHIHTHTHTHTQITLDFSIPDVLCVSLSFVPLHTLLLSHTLGLTMKLVPFDFEHIMKSDGAKHSCLCQNKQSSWMNLTHMITLDLNLFRVLQYVHMFGL